MSIPTRVKRWLKTDAGRQYVLIPRATARALFRLYDWARARLGAISWPALVGLAATLDDIENEIADLRRELDDNG